MEDWQVKFLWVWLSYLKGFPCLSHIVFSLYETVNEIAGKTFNISPLGCACLPSGQPCLHLELSLREVIVFNFVRASFRYEITGLALVGYGESRSKV